ncbi:MAG: DUF4277 domain-containing protein, partial [Mariprofundales bacterium]
MTNPSVKESQDLKHLGLVAGMYDELGIGDFFANKPVERLIGKGIMAEHLNDDLCGRTLD